jgi:hypothetical protein
MPRRASDSNPDGKRPCAFCRTLRVVVIFALLMVALMAYADKLSWLEDIQFTDIFANSIAGAFFLVLGYKVWAEYWKPKKHAEGRNERREEMEKLFDEMDEAVAKREAETVLEDSETGGDTLTAHMEESDRHEETHNQNGELVTADTHTVSLDVTVTHKEPSTNPELDEQVDIVEPVEVAELVATGEAPEAEGVESEETGDERDKKQPEQLDIFGFELKDK